MVIPTDSSNSAKQDQKIAVSTIKIAVGENHAPSPNPLPRPGGEGVK